MGGGTPIPTQLRGWFNHVIVPVIISRSDEKFSDCLMIKAKLLQTLLPAHMMYEYSFYSLFPVIPQSSVVTMSRDVQ